MKYRKPHLMGLTIRLYRLGNYFYKKNFVFFSIIIDNLNWLISNSFIPSTCEIGEGSMVSYGGTGIVINTDVKIGRKCIIGQQVTIGGRNGEKQVPKIKDNVYIGSGAKIYGPILIEEFVIIAPNTVVTKNIEKFTIYAGNPGKEINKITKENFKKYQDYFCENPFND